MSEAKRARVAPAPLSRESFVFFWHPPCKNGWLSNWSPHGVLDEQGLWFATVEHFFMYRKAITFGDHATARRIFEAPTPGEAKQLGRLVAGFNEAQWERERERVMVEGLKRKVMQRQALYDALLQTGDRIIAEASPYDRTWGIGLFEEDERAIVPDRWPGTNLLGKCWMRVREDLHTLTKDDPPQAPQAAANAATCSSHANPR